MEQAGGAASLDALHGLDAVADGVAEVQRLAHTLLGLVLLHDALFKAQAAADDVADAVVHVLFFKDGEQLRVGQKPGLDGLGQTVDEVAAGQGGQGVRVHDDQLGLPEGTHDVLGVAQIHGGLAADGGIDHGKGGGGAVDKIDAAHIDGSGKPGKVAHHAAAHGYHKVAPAHAKVQHLPQHGLQNFKALAGFALRHGDDSGILALVGYHLGVLCRHTAVGDHRHPAVQPGELVQVFQRAALDDDVVAALAQIHGQLGSDKITHFVYTPNSRTVRQVRSSSRSSAAVSPAAASPTSST